MFTSDVTKARSFTRNLVYLNYHLFTHSDVSYRFNGENENIMLELQLSLA